MIYSRKPFARVTAALMEIAARERDNGATDFEPGGPIVIRARDVPVVSAWEPPKVHNTSADAWRRQGKRRGRHAR